MAMTILNPSSSPGVSLRLPDDLVSGLPCLPAVPGAVRRPVPSAATRVRRQPESR
jgi:hypothetical protein